jgi:Icc-related predicted phosphoesterase
LKALVTTDLHSSDRAAKTITHGLMAGDFDVHLCLGDIITFRPLEYLEDLFRDPPVPTYTVPGNTDSDEARARMVEMGMDIHFKQVTVEGITIAGAGGCTPPPFRTAFVVEEEEYDTKLPPVLEGAQLLASHGPARGLLDRSLFGGMRVGSKAVFRAVERARPAVVLSGHIHEARGIAVYDWEEERVVARDREFLESLGPGRTLFFNPGPAKDGYVGRLEVTDDLVRAHGGRV